MRRRRSTRRSEMAAALAAAAALAVAMGGCGKPEVCMDQGVAGGFPQMVTEEWEPYCEQLDTYIREGSTDLVMMTGFYAAHPERVAELRTKLKRFDRPERCYSEPHQQLDWRRLNDCLETDGSMLEGQARSFGAQASVVHEEASFRLQKAQRLSAELAKKEEHLSQKLGQQFQIHRPMDTVLLEEFQALLAEMQKEVEVGRKAVALWDEVLQAAAPNRALTEAIKAQMGKQMKAYGEDLAKVEEALAGHEKDAAFFALAVPSVGKECPPATSRSRRRERLARDLLGDRRTKVGGDEIMLTSDIEEHKKGPVIYEVFTGHICGDRPEERQFVERPRLCTIYTFSIQRSRGEDDSDFDDWRVTTFEEAGAEGGIDCVNKR